MTAPVSASERDLRTLAAIVTENWPDLPAGEGLQPLVLDDLLGLIPVLTLLRPYLHQAYLDAERRRRGTPQLTRRQWEVLRLVADGHTNVQIAHRLGVSEGTVRIHLQNIYVRLQVSSRTAAVSRAFPRLVAM